MEKVSSWESTNCALLILLASASVGGDEGTVNAVGMWGLRERLVLPAGVANGVVLVGEIEEISHCKANN